MITEFIASPITHFGRLSKYDFCFLYYILHFFDFLFFELMNVVILQFLVAYPYLTDNSFR